MAGRTVHVGNLNVSLDADTVRELFKHCGEIVAVRLTGSPAYQYRYAFVEFKDEVMAASACLLDGLQVLDRTMRVSLAKGSQAKATDSSGSKEHLHRAQDPERIARTIHISGIDPQVTEGHLVQFFSLSGRVVGVRISGTSAGGQRTGWVEFDSRTAVAGALELNGTILGGGTLRISQSKTAIQNKTSVLPDASAYVVHTMTQAPTQSGAPHRVYVGNLAPSATEDDLKTLFSLVGPVVRVVLGGSAEPASGYAFVEFEHAAGPLAALALSGSNVRGSAIIVAPAQETPQPAPIALPIPNQSANSPGLISSGSMPDTQFASFSIPGVALLGGHQLGLPAHQAKDLPSGLDDTSQAGRGVAPGAALLGPGGAKGGEGLLGHGGEEAAPRKALDDPPVVSRGLVATPSTSQNGQPPPGSAGVLGRSPASPSAQQESGRGGYLDNGGARGLGASSSAGLLGQKPASPGRSFGGTPRQVALSSSGPSEGGHKRTAKDSLDQVTKRQR